MGYESLKIYTDDWERVKGVRLERGIPLVEAVGCCIEAWDKLSKREQDQIIRARAQRQHGEPVASSTPS